MATTFVPKYDQPIVVTLEEFREAAQDMLERARGDEDKADEMENWYYYEGYADALENTLKWMTGVDQDEEKTHGSLS